MRHIALVTTSYPEGPAGSEAAGSFVEDFARRLSATVRVSVVAPGSEYSQGVDNNLHIRRFKAPRIPLSLLKPGHPMDWPAILKTLMRGYKCLQQLCAEDRPDHILALWALPSGFWARRLLKEQGIPYSIWALGSDIWSLGKVPFIRKQLNMVLKSASTCYADGYQLARDVEDIGAVSCTFLPSTRSITASSGDTGNGKPPYKLAFLGRWHPNKGVDIVLDALMELSNDSWHAIKEVRVCGGGPLEDLVQDKIDTLSRNGHPVSKKGFLGKDEARSLIEWADYLVLPSRIESIPVVFSDAAKLNTPIIATPAGDLPRLHEQFNFGVLAASCTVTAYRDAITTALKCSPHDFEPGLAKAAETFDLDRIVSTFLSRFDAGNSGHKT